MAGKLWHLVTISGGGDGRAIEMLKRNGYEHFYPSIVSMRLVARRFLSHAQRKAEAQPMRPHREPLFPGYPFVRFDPQDGRWHDLFDLAGVRGIVCKGDLPAIVPDGLVAELIAKAQQNGGAIPASAKVAELFKVGETVRCLAGTFVGSDARIETLPDCAIGDLDESARVGLVIKLFGRPVQFSLPLGAIERTA